MYSDKTIYGISLNGQAYQSVFIKIFYCFQRKSFFFSNGWWLINMGLFFLQGSVVKIESWECDPFSLDMVSSQWCAILMASQQMMWKPKFSDRLWRHWKCKTVWVTQEWGHLHLSFPHVELLKISSFSMFLGTVQSPYCHDYEPVENSRNCIPDLFLSTMSA